MISGSRRTPTVPSATRLRQPPAGLAPPLSEKVWGRGGLGGGRREAGRPTGRRRRGWSLWVGLTQAPVLHGVLMRREGREGTVAGRWSWRRLSGLFSFSLCTLFSFQCRCFGGLLLPSYAISTAL